MFISVLLELHQPARLWLLGRSNAIIEVYRGNTLSNVPNNPSSEQSREFLLDCLSQCLNSHELCNKSTNAVPTRLLEIINDISSVRLIEPDQSGADRYRYACFSHCWGDGYPLKTTKAAVQDRNTQINHSELPANFQDAIAVCRWVGIDYIRLDSLCIIQDSKSDLEEESKMIRDVYKKALFVIAVSSSISYCNSFLRLTRLLRIHCDFVVLQIITQICARTLE
ncbi:hypothetical protein B0J11DRAFT_447849 [Dendryphion nanum]|uniref:Heterokaryon incompatibility domain-containing protein n=1 Tax=Dendryphion nanum TaxID=256645 RepID=A0A9P9I8Y8_9PLEO|nr:hypothetical protein B0J11DRAFT_447849 [Dendryphion nanum]